MRSFTDNIAKLNDIGRQCNMKNWNGYDAEPIPIEIIDFCSKVVWNLGIQPEIFPTACQSIQLEYEKDSEYMEIGIFKTTISIYKKHKDWTEENYQIDYDINSIVDEVQKYLYSL